MIRKATENDARAISQIRINGWKTAYKGIVDNNFLNEMDYEKDYQKLRNRISGNDENFNANIIVYVDDETKEVLGFSTFGEILAEVDLKKYDCELYALYVKPENKGKGIGKQLLAYVKEYFKTNNKNNMILFCLKDNYPSRAFYRNNGGIEVEEIEKEICNEKLKEIGYEFKLQ